MASNQGGNSLLCLYDVASGKEVGQITDPSGGATSLRFSPDGRTLAAWHSKQGKSVLIFWETATGKERARLVEEEGFHGGALAFSPDGRTLASSYPDNRVCLWEVATGRKRHCLEGHRGPISSLCWSADAKRLLSGSYDTSILVWDMTQAAHDRPRANVHLTPKELEALWTQLAGNDAALAYTAEAKLTAAPQDSLAFLKEHLPPAPAAHEDKRITQLVGDLDADDFAVREKAIEGLQKLGEPAEPALRRALKGQPPLEVKRRIEQLLEKLRMPPERLQALRALEVLERLDTAESRQLLKELTDGAPDAWLTHEVKAINWRLAANHQKAP
jgi:hypothetical protein